MTDITLTLVGDGLVGKTTLLNRYILNEMTMVHLATTFNNEVKTVEINNKKYNLHFWDTAGQEGYDKISEVAYDGTSVYLLCYAMNKLDSLNNCLNKWLPEMMKRKKCPVFLIGTKMDLVEDLESARTTGEGYAAKMKASGFFMTSSLTGEGVEEAILGSCVPMTKKMPFIRRINMRCSIS